MLYSQEYFIYICVSKLTEWSSETLNSHQNIMKKHNFNAGPSILADEVLENAAKAIIDFNGSGLSLLSISHRTKDFDDVMAEADALFREMLDIPEDYKIFYIGGGASTFFYEVPANFLGKKAGYVNTGVWAKKAMKAT